MDWEGLEIILCTGMALYEVEEAFVAERLAQEKTSRRKERKERIEEVNRR